jgi:hypothetical protein
VAHTEVVGVDDQQPSVVRVSKQLVGIHGAHSADGEVEASDSSRLSRVLAGTGIAVVSVPVFDLTSTTESSSVRTGATPPAR